VRCVFNLPDFIHFDRLGQQINEIKISTNRISVVCNLMDFRMDKSGAVARSVCEVDSLRGAGMILRCQ
ncbi:MAG: hypothetical protein NT150_00160, partial [Bacteroidetes bacterium]|nr:hypothetical protein [Bacteroidota bacterium]